MKSYLKFLSRNKLYTTIEAVGNGGARKKEKPHLTCVRRGFEVTPTGLKPVTF